MTSPILKDEADQVLRECPVSVVLRHGAFIYDAIGAHGVAELGALNLLEQPPWLQRAIGVIASEKARLRELRSRERQAHSDSDYGMRLRGG